MKEIEDLIKDFRAFGNEAAMGISSNALNNYLHKMYNAIRYENVQTFTQLFSRLIILSNYHDKDNLLNYLTNYLYQKRNLPYTKTSLMQIMLMAFLSGYYEKVKENEQNSA